MPVSQSNITLIMNSDMLLAEKAIAAWLAGYEGDPSVLHSTGKAVSGVQSSVLVSSV